jgi:hypothetical protein
MTVLKDTFLHRKLGVIRYVDIFAFHNSFSDSCFPGEKYGDSSDTVWSMYLTEAEKQDKDVIESWKGDTDGILVFVSLTPYFVS